MKTPQFFRALSQHPPEPSWIPAEFQDTFYITQRLTNLPYNYWPTEKPLLAAVDLLHIHHYDKLHICIFIFVVMH